MIVAWISGGEIFLLLMVGLLLFGGKLPEVAKDVGRLFLRARRALDDIRRESGIDETLRDLERESRALDSGIPDFSRSSRTEAPPQKPVVPPPGKDVPSAQDAGGKPAENETGDETKPREAPPDSQER